MARYNEILTGRHNRFLQKFFGMKGGPPAPQLSSDIQTVVSLSSGTDIRFVESWNRFFVASSVPAVAAQFSTVQFNNPANSGMIAVLEKLNLASSTTFRPTLSFDFVPAAVLANVGAGVALDRRDTRRIGALIQSSTNLVAATSLGFTLYVMLIAANTTIELIGYENQELVLTPGSALRILDTTVNTELLVNACWRERALEDSERF